MTGPILPPCLSIFGTLPSETLTGPKTNSSGGYLDWSHALKRASTPLARTCTLNTSKNALARSSADASIAALLTRSKARDQLKRLRGRLIKAIDNDRRRGLVTRNVAELSVVPAVSPKLTPRRAARVLSVEDLGSLLTSTDGAVGVLIDLSGRHGLRPAEARGLRWSRVDLENATIRIDAQINRRNEITKAKTKRAYRTIQVDAETVNRFADWQVSQEYAEREAGPAWSGNTQDLIATTAFGTSINQRNVHRSLRQVSRRLDLEPAVAAYDLRHTAITFQVERGHSIHQIADWAGTSESMIINVYRHKLTEVSNLGPSNHQE